LTWLIALENFIILPKYLSLQG